MPENELQPLTEPDAPEEERQLCVSCVAPNHPLAHFCSKCGAPLTPYAAIGPFERIFAEGFIFRRAVQKPQKFIVVLGVWICFVLPALAGIIGLLNRSSIRVNIIGFMFFAPSAVILYLTTRNYFRQKAGRHPETAEHVNPPA